MRAWVGTARVMTRALSSLSLPRKGRVAPRSGAGWGLLPKLRARGEDPTRPAFASLRRATLPFRGRDGARPARDRVHTARAQLAIDVRENPFEVPVDIAIPVAKDPEPLPLEMPVPPQVLGGVCVDAMLAAVHLDHQ